MRGMEAERFDLTITSPPYDAIREYGVGFDADAFEWKPILSELLRVTKPGGVVVWVVSDQTIDGSETGTSFRQALYAKEIGFNLHDTMIYMVKGTGAKGSNLSYWQAFEYMFVLSRGRPKAVNRIKDKPNSKAGTVNRSVAPKSIMNGSRIVRAGVEIGRYGYRTNVWEIHPTNGNDRTDHPAPFPEALARDHIRTWSAEGDTVFDPMMGSGTTGKKAIELGRRFIGCEIDPDYFAIAEKRIEEAAKQPPLFVDAPATSQPKQDALDL